MAAATAFQSTVPTISPKAQSWQALQLTCCYKVLDPKVGKNDPYDRKDGKNDSIFEGIGCDSGLDQEKSAQAICRAPANAVKDLHKFRGSPFEAEIDSQLHKNRNEIEEWHEPLASDLLRGKEGGKFFGMGKIQQKSRH